MKPICGEAEAVAEVEFFLQTAEVFSGDCGDAGSVCVEEEDVMLAIGVRLHHANCPSSGECRFGYSYGADNGDETIGPHLYGLACHRYVDWEGEGEDVSAFRVFERAVVRLLTSPSGEVRINKELVLRLRR